MASAETPFVPAYIVGVYKSHSEALNALGCDIGKLQEIAFDLGSRLAFECNDTIFIQHNEDPTKAFAIVTSTLDGKPAAALMIADFDLVSPTIEQAEAWTLPGSPTFVLRIPVRVAEGRA
jgi:hypothetical protein